MAKINKLATLDRLDLQKNKKAFEFQSFNFSSTGLSPIGNPTFEQWKECGFFLGRWNKTFQWWIGDFLNCAERKWSDKYTELEELTRLDNQTLRNYKWVTSRIDKYRRRDNLSFTHHADVASFKPEEQDKLLDKATKDDIPRSKFRQVVRNYRHSLLPKVVLPPDKFDVIYADPPWKYEFQETYSREIENHYPTMKLEDIINLKDAAGKPIIDVIADNAILFLWATAPKTEEAIQVVNAWGFTYRTNMVWDKEIIGLGYWARGQHELLLIGVRGNFASPQQNVRVSSVYKERRSEHSKKPDYYHDVIEKYFPHGKYLELFARQKRNDKWTVWGNQI